MYFELASSINCAGVICFHVFPSTLTCSCTSFSIVSSCSDISLSFCLRAFVLLWLKAPETKPMVPPPMAPKAKAFNNALCSCPSSPDISVATSAMKSSTPSWAASVVPSTMEATWACPTAALATLLSTPSAINLSVTFLSVVFLNRTGIKGLRPKAIEATSKAATMAPPVMAVPGASKPSPARAFISRSISPVLSIKEGRKAPKAPPTIPPTNLAPGIGIAAAARAPALAP